MTAWRSLGGVVTVLALAVAGRGAETYPLAETVEADACFRYHLEMKLTGEIRLTKEDKPVSVPLTTAAKHTFPERVLAVSDKGVVEKVARHYEEAKVVIAAGERSERAFREDRRLIVAQRVKGQPLVYCPAGALTREELGLTEHLDTLLLTGLLPGKAVAAGETWKVGNDAAQALCTFEGLTNHDLTCKLDEVKDGVARVAVSGSATGIDLGAMVKLKVEGSYRFDLNSKRLTELTWKQKDDRDQGPASPAMTVETTTTLKREQITQPAALDDVQLVSVPPGFDAPASLTNLYHADPKGRFQLAYAREWQKVGQTDKHLFLRLMDRGDFVAQVTITPWTPAKPGEHMAPEVFQKTLAETPGWKQTEVLQTGVVPSESGRYVYRVSTLGEMDGIQVMQNFYLIAGPGGEQVIAAFTMTPKQADKLGARDLSLAGSIDFPGKGQEGDKK